MTSPSQVLDYMAGVKASLSDLDVRTAIQPVLYTGGLTEAGRRIDNPNSKEWEFQTQYASQQWLDDEARRLEMSHAYLITPDMVDLIDFAGRTWPESAPLQREQLPTEFGFAYFDKPLESVDVQGLKMRHHLITWGVAHDRSRGWDPGVERTKANQKVYMRHGVRVNFYADRDDLEDPYTRQLAKEYEGTRLWRAYRFQLSESVFWSWNGTFAAYEDEVKLYRDVEGIDFEALPMMPTSESAMAHRMMAFWTLCMQEVTNVQETEVDRPTRRRMGRANLPSRISVITLRRKSSNGTGESQVEWHHRWIVRGHWRQQPYKDPLTGGTYTKPIWINPYIKGPDDKPIIQTEKVYRLSR